MDNKKITISLTTVIIIVVVIIVILAGAAAYIILNSNNNNNNDNDNNKGNIGNNNQSYQNNIDNEEIVDNNTNNSNNNDQQAEGTSSSKTSPLSVGKWGVASKYSSGKYTEIPARVTKVTRGNVAAQEIKQFCDSDASIYQYSEPKEAMEWAVIEYEIDLTSFSTGTSVRIDNKITGTGDSSSIKYNGNMYITSTMNMTSNDMSSGIASGKFAAQLPIGCTDYLIVLGSSSSTQAFFMGQ